MRFDDMVIAWVSERPGYVLGLLLSIILAVDLSVMSLWHADSRRRGKQRMWARRMANLNGVVIRCVLWLWVILHFYFHP